MTRKIERKKGDRQKWAVEGGSAGVALGTFEVENEARFDTGGAAVAHHPLRAKKREKQQQHNGGEVPDYGKTDVYFKEAPRQKKRGERAS